MKKIKILLAVRPKILAEVIRDMVARQPDMEVVGEVGDPIELLLVAGSRSIDAVIVSPLDAAEEPKICHHLLAEYPRLKIVALTEKGDAAFLYDSGFRKRPIEETSEAAILEAVRTAIHQG